MSVSRGRVIQRRIKFFLGEASDLYFFNSFETLPEIEKNWNELAVFVPRIPSFLNPLIPFKFIF